MPSLLRASKPAPPTRVGEFARPEKPLPIRVDSSEDRCRCESGPRGVEPQDDLTATVGQFLGQMMRTSRRILHDDGLADDAIQEAFLTFWARGEPPENPQAWLLRAVTLRSLHLARSCRRRREHERRACLGRPEWSVRDEPSRLLDHSDLLRILDESLGQVSHKYRSVFDLWAFEEMDYAGIAETLHIPIGTVRSRLNRIRKAMRAALRERFAEQDPGGSSHHDRPEPIGPEGPSPEEGYTGP
jgi:RNA polymerase sigma-70 factor (ECF subfamily)